MSFFLYVVIPLVANLALSVFACFFLPDHFSGHVDVSYFVALAGAGAAVATLLGTMGAAGREIRTGHALFALVAHAVMLVFVFAGIYRGFGLILSTNLVADSNGDVHNLVAVPPVVAWDTALYFSVVTWTTLGYGDFTPMPDIRLVAALQALLGYIFFGLIVGLTADHVVRRA